MNVRTLSCGMDDGVDKEKSRLGLAGTSVGRVWGASDPKVSIFPHAKLPHSWKNCVGGDVPIYQRRDSVRMSALNWKPFVYGGLASITAECGTFPIDLTKTRLQIQGQTNDANFKEIRYRGMLHALVRIGREEGLKALYSGIAPAMLRQASYGTIKIGTYQSLKRLFVERPEDETLPINVICGILSGVISSTIANPTDVLKCKRRHVAVTWLSRGCHVAGWPGTFCFSWLETIRMQAQSSTFQGGMIGNFMNIYQQEGTRGLWKGVSLTAQRAAIVVGVELPVYDITKKHLILSGLMGDTVYTHFLSSFTCGLAGALASNPVDVVRTRMMNQRVLRDGRRSGYTGTLDCLLQTWKNEGFFALYKGFWPNWLRLGPWNIIVSFLWGGWFPPTGVDPNFRPGPADNLRCQAGADSQICTDNPQNPSVWRGSCGPWVAGGMR
ncbi:hypothetical protein P7K49_012560 [Saguinus oedipus]|uniref:Solute carrier family 25 member 30 n=1 Tax=Saguinus oedipus TaxID=9490 RepID=A0ABQ9VTT6_SAGOE|nr:hypothetical protein P7K49_012560 [Saguinus oedipus]